MSTLPLALRNVIKQASRLDAEVRDKTYNLYARIITPTEQLVLTFPSALATLSLFGINHSDDIRVVGMMSPGVYLNSVLPYKDTLYLELIKREGLSQTVCRYRAIPLGDGDPRVAGSHSSLSNLTDTDSINLVDVSFQLMDVGYSYLKNQLISDINLMSTLKDVIRYHLTVSGNNLTLQGPDAFKGVTLVEPVDNDKIFRQVIIPPNTRLVKLPSYLQAHDEYGVYGTGLGNYYRKGMWYIYPLFRTGVYSNSDKVLDIYHLPDNVAPTLKATYLTTNDRVTTILTTGIGKVINDKDISKQNKGVGKRIMSSDMLTAETGYFYKDGVAITTREDSVSEFKTSARNSNEEYIAFDPKPTNNLCRVLSENAFNEGYILEIQWDNSNHELIKPAMPLRYYYVDETDRLVYVEGTVLSIRTEAVKDNQNISNLLFRDKSKLQLWLSTEVTVVP